MHKMIDNGELSPPWQPPAAATTVPGLLADRVRADAGAVFMVCDDEVLDYAALDRASYAVSQRLMAAGVGKGSRVGLLMPNGTGWAVVSMGVLRTGAVLVPLSTLLRPPELRSQLEAAALSGLVTVRSYRNRSYLEDLEEALPGSSRLSGQLPHPALPSLRQVWTWEENLTTEPGPLAPVPEPAVRPADDMAILFTSGSRGVPKGTVHTHGSALRAVASSIGARCVRPGDRLYIPMPFFWAGGLASGLLTSLVAGVTLLTEVSPEPSATVKFLKRERVTLFRGWPQQAARIAADPAYHPADLPSLRPGSLDPVLPPELRARPGARANLFGMSETFGPYAGYPLDTDLPPDKFGSCGRPFDGVEVRIVDPQSGQPVPAGSVGEIALRGPNVMRGIYGRERHDVFDADGFYATGDAGRLDADGFLWYDGRLDDMFKVSGATVYPAEVEKGLLSIPGVAQAFVVGVNTGAQVEVGAAVLGPGLGVAELRRAAREALSSFKVPTLWLLLGSEADVPRLASDKPDVNELRDRLSRHGLRAPAA
jgi:acyl-CoA synthetase (AMP-forming)/AMP-acid ligase II